MKRFSSFLVVSLLSLPMVLLLPRTGAARTEANSSKPSQLDTLLRAAHARGVFNGNALVAKDGKIIYQASIGHADASKTTPLAPHHRFDIGSIAKEFNGAGIMLLVEQGKLTLADKVSRHLPGLPPWAASVEVRHLLDYTSGLPAPKAESDEAIFAEVLAVPALAFAPGTAYIYSNANVVLQKRIIERITGRSYGQFVEANLFIPCRMATASIEAPAGKLPMARAFSNSFVASEYPVDDRAARLAIADLLKWTQCLHSHKAITKASLRTLATSFGGNQSSLGRATFANGQLQLHEHDGSGYNYEALVHTDAQDGVTIVLMTNNQNFKLGEIQEAITAILNAKPFHVPRKSIYLDLREKVLADLETGLAFYRRIKATEQDTYDFASEHGDLRKTAKYLMRRDRFDDAIRIIHLAALLPPPGSPDVAADLDLLGEAHRRKGNKQQAILYYQKSFALDPQNENAKGVLDQLLNEK